MAQRRILVVDDEDDVRDVWVDALRGAGYAAVGLGTGAEALGRLVELQPDLILLDMMMPGVDGFEFLARVRAPPTSPTSPC